MISTSALFYDTNVAKEYETSGAMIEWKAAYERKYSTTRLLPKASVEHVEAKIDLYPSQERARARGRLQLVNRTNQPIEMLLVAVRKDASNEELTLDGATLQTRDERFNQFIFRFTTPLLPGARSNLRFDVTYDEGGLRSGRMPVTENGTMMESFRIFPTVGYRRGYEILENDIRQKHNLPIVDRLAVSAESVAEASDDWITTDVTLSTAGDETAVITGDLVRKWSDAGRNYFHYRTTDPVRYAITVVSGRFASAGVNDHDHSLEIYHHPDHAQNVKKILDTAIASLAYQEANFGPYRHQALRIAEVPASFRAAGYAQPGVIYLGERRLFQIDPSRASGVDVVARRVAHEVAHQWWGLGLAPAGVEGGLLITESLAKYSELAITENMFGPAHTRAQLDYELDRYLGRRSSASYGEPPLSKVKGEAEIYYAKGAIVLNAIRHLLGEKTMNLALRTFYEKHSGPQGRSTAADLIAELKAVAANDEDRALIDRWMNDIAVYDLKIEKGSVTGAQGSFDVEATVGAARVTIDAAGAEHRSDLGENVPFALYDEDGKVIHAGKARLDRTTTRLHFTLKQKPASIVVDPDLTRIDPAQRDNSFTFP